MNNCIIFTVADLMIDEICCKGIMGSNAILIEEKNIPGALLHREYKKITCLLFQAGKVR